MRKSSNAPHWMVAKFPGKDQVGRPFGKGDWVFYFPTTGRFLTGLDAENAARESKLSARIEFANTFCYDLFGAQAFA